MKAFITITLSIGLLLSCGENKSDKSISESTSKETHKERSSGGQIVHVSSDYVSLLTNIKEGASTREVEFINEVLSNTNTFENQNVDTTLLTIGNIDGIGKLDTIKTHIFIKNDSVFLNSTWHRDGELMWKNILTNPYMWISEKEEFAYDSRSLWVIFTIAVNHSIPELVDKEQFSNLNPEFIVQIGYQDLLKYDSTAKKEVYTKYIDSFHGQLLSIGEPESHRNPVIWYEPKNIFLRYFGS